MAVEHGPACDTGEEVFLGVDPAIASTLHSRQGLWLVEPSGHPIGFNTGSKVIFVVGAAGCLVLLLDRRLLLCCIPRKTPVNTTKKTKRADRNQSSQGKATETKSLCSACCFPFPPPLPNAHPHMWTLKPALTQWRRAAKQSEHVCSGDPSTNVHRKGGKREKGKRKRRTTHERMKHKAAPKEASVDH